MNLFFLCSGFELQNVKTKFRWKWQQGCPHKWTRVLFNRIKRTEKIFLPSRNYSCRKISSGKYKKTLPTPLHPPPWLNFPQHGIHLSIESINVTFFSKSSSIWMLWSFSSLLFASCLSCLNHQDYLLTSFWMVPWCRLIL